MCCPESRMSFKGCWFPRSVSWGHFTEISGRCRAASTVGLSLWLEASPQGKCSNLSCLPVFYFFLWRTIKQNLFHTEVPLCSWPGMDQASPAVFPFPKANSSALCLGLQLLYFTFPGNEERSKWEYFACLDSVIQLIAHWEREKELKSTYKEGKIAKADRNSTSKTFVVILDHDIQIHAEMWEILNSEGYFKDYRTMNMLQRGKRPWREAGVKSQQGIFRHAQQQMLY